ncbi:YheC/D like ATP-grasp [Paenibacillus sp. yr247]|uniref:YheC/YheD family endospore coat-associated protein n=1 Tax=Paenibacillus sp. yr247 TaxID=1761880 RepID=UPI0008870623|nr:YheC/YheD family protein [Paenibacillus sp. yr247]SDN75784.1 YheC/D like ATP-grasp [Paenibacillus sp. yr247]
MRTTVGVLLDLKTYLGISKGRTGTERLALYNIAGENHGLRPFYMSLHHLRGKTALGYYYENNAYKLVRRSIPKVTHNRAIALSPFLRKKLKELSKSSIVFNEQNRYDKLHIHQLLYANHSLRTYLPESTKYSREQLKTALKKYSSLFIKPTSSSVGDGIIKISKQEGGGWNLYWMKGKPKLVTYKEAVSFIAKKVGKRNYMIQEAIPLATYNGQPYDLRISVQRGGSGQWQVTGMIGKVAALGRHVTNVAKGGKVKRVEELFDSSGFYSPLIKHELQQVSLSIAQYIGIKLPQMADIGLDVGVDAYGNIKLIEVNGRDQRYTFKKADLETTFYHTYETPLRYAKFLLNQST